MVNCANFKCSQGNGLPPTLIARGNAPGESGVSVLHAHFRDGGHLSSVDDSHLVFLHLSEAAWVECCLAGERLAHQAQLGTMGICPSGADCIVESTSDIEGLIVAIDPGALALAASEGSAPFVDVIPCLADKDLELLRLGRILAQECRADYPNGPLYWHELADRFIERVLARHTTRKVDDAAGTLSREVLAKLRDYIHAHLDQPIEVAELAGIACRSPFHFTRVFSRSVGFTPHRYVVHLRLKRALELIREGKHGFADVAACTGFADQSHLSRWVRRVHGVSLRQLSARTGAVNRLPSRLLPSVAAGAARHASR
jgi:AraC family transcriptional regulator